MTWQAVFAERFNARGLDRPQRPPVPAPYVRLTDEQIAALPEELRAVARFSRSMWDAMTPVRESLSRIARQVEAPRD